MASARRTISEMLDKSSLYFSKNFVRFLIMFPNQFLAINGGELIAHDFSYGGLNRELRKKVSGKNMDSVYIAFVAEKNYVPAAA
jgi:hypothetical protein